MRTKGRSPTSAIAPPAGVANNNFKRLDRSNFHCCSEDVNRARWALAVLADIRNAEDYDKRGCQQYFRSPFQRGSKMSKLCEATDLTFAVAVNDRELSETSFLARGFRFF